MFADSLARWRKTQLVFFSALLPVIRAQQGEGISNSFCSKPRTPGLETLKEITTTKTLLRSCRLDQHFSGMRSKRKTQATRHTYVRACSYTYEHTLETVLKRGVIRIAAVMYIACRPCPWGASPAPKEYKLFEQPELVRVNLARASLAWLTSSKVTHDLKRIKRNKPPS